MNVLLGKEGQEARVYL